MPTTDLTDPTTWASVTLAADEIWQCRGLGSILTTVEAPLRDDQGIEIVAGHVRTFKAGQTVRYRPQIPPGVDARVILSREAL